MDINMKYEKHSTTASDKQVDPITKASLVTATESATNTQSNVEDILKARQLKMYRNPNQINNSFTETTSLNQIAEAMPVNSMLIYYTDDGTGAPQEIMDNLGEDQIYNIIEMMKFSQYRVSITIYESKGNGEKAEVWFSSYRRPATTGDSGIADFVSVGGYLPLTGGTLSGDLNFSNTGENKEISWRADSYYQRLQVIDNNTSNDSVFKFQQSSNSGQSWTDLLTINDNGDIVANRFTGDLYGGNVYLRNIGIHSYDTSNKLIFGTSSTPYVVLRANTSNQLVISNSVSSNERAVAFYFNDDPISFSPTTDLVSDKVITANIGTSSRRWNSIYLVEANVYNNLTLSNKIIQRYNSDEECLEFIFE